MANTVETIVLGGSLGLVDNYGTPISAGNPLAVAIGGGTGSVATTNTGRIVTHTAITRPANITAYAIGDLVANSATAGLVSYPALQAARGIDLVSMLTAVTLEKSDEGDLALGQFRVHFYNKNMVFANGDNGAWSTIADGYIGHFDITIDTTFSDFNLGRTTGQLMFAPISGSANINWAIEARAAYVPADSETFRVTLEVN